MTLQTRGQRALRRAVAALMTTALMVTAGGTAALAAEGQDAPAGTARASLTALDVTVTGVPVEVPGTTLLDLSSFASTDRDGARNPAGAPFAAVEALPARLAGQELGTTRARSDGDGDSSAPTVEQAVGPVSVTVNPFSLSAGADAGSARAVLEGAIGRLRALGDAVRLTVDDAGVETSVDGAQATALQSLRVSGLEIDLGDLLPDLSQLPLSVVLELAAQLSGQLGGTVGDLAGVVTDLTGKVQDALADLEVAVDSYTTTSSELKALLARISDLEQDLADLQQALADAEQTLASGDLSGADDLLESGNQLIEDTTDDLTGTVDSTLDTLDHDPVHSLEQLVEDLEAQIAAVESTLADLQEQADALIQELVDILRRIRSLVGQVDTLAGQLLTAVQDLLAQLPDLLDALARADLVDIGAVTVGLSATATEDASEAVLGCTVDHVRLVGVALPAADCTAPLSGASLELRQALDRVEGVLGALPVVGDVVPDVTLEMFSDAAAERGFDGPYRTARAHVTALRFALPSVELGEVTDGLLDSLAGLDLSTSLESLAATLEADAEALSAVTELADDIDATLTTVRGAIASVVDVESTLADLLAGLPAADALAGVRTPGLEVVVDPTVTAEFRGAMTAPGDPGAPGAPGGPDQPAGPTLPVTGGERGLLLLAALFLVSAAGIAVTRRLGEVPGR